MVERDAEDWLERALEDERRTAAASPPPPGGFADVQGRRAHRHAQRRRDAAVALATSLVFLAVVGTARWWLRPSAGDWPTTGATGQAAAGPGPAGPSPALQTSGGTVALVAEADARVRELGDRVFAVDAGTVCFAVEPGSGRMEVRAPDRTIVVVGTVFAVRVGGTAGAARTAVGVLSGRVRVETTGGGAVDVAAGEQLPPGAAVVLPLDPAWRARMTAVFPERAAREARPGRGLAQVGDHVSGGAGLQAPGAGLQASGCSAAQPPSPFGAGLQGPDPKGPGGLTAEPSVAPSTEAVATAPQPARAAGERPAGPAAAPAVPGGAPLATAGQGAVAAGMPAGGAVPAVPPPAPVAGAPSDSRPLPWRALYQQAWNRLGGDPEGAAAAIEALIDSAPTAADAEDAMVALASIYHDNLGQFTRARAVYERYLKRFPAGTYRRDVWMRLCLAYGETGDAEKQRLCLQAFAADR